MTSAKKLIALCKGKVLFSDINDQVLIRQLGGYDYDYAIFVFSESMKSIVVNRLFSNRLFARSVAGP
jgi:hypothetical protein